MSDQYSFRWVEHGRKLHITYFQGRSSYRLCVGGFKFLRHLYSCSLKLITVTQNRLHAHGASSRPSVRRCIAGCQGWWRSSSALALIAGWFLMIPFSTASHLHCAFQGHYSHILIRLDQTGPVVPGVGSGPSVGRAVRIMAGTDFRLETTLLNQHQISVETH